MIEQDHEYEAEWSGATAGARRTPCRGRSRHQAWRPASSTDDDNGVRADTSRLGRPRSSTADQAILDATVKLFADRGYDGLTIEAVAEQAGVAKSTIYRRYTDKAELLAAVECSTDSASAAPDTGSLADDLYLIAKHLRRVLSSTDAGKTLPATIAAMERHPALAEAHQAFFATASGRAHRGRSRDRRGEIAKDTDPELFVDMVAGPIFYLTFVRRTSVDDPTLRRLVDAPWRGIAGRRRRTTRVRWSTRQPLGSLVTCCADAPATCWWSSWRFSRWASASSPPSTARLVAGAAGRSDSTLHTSDQATVVAPKRRIIRAVRHVAVDAPSVSASATRRLAALLAVATGLLLAPSERGPDRWRRHLAWVLRSPPARARPHPGSLTPSAGRAVPSACLGRGP